MRQRTKLLGLDLMGQRLHSPHQQDRMIRDKARTLEKATKYSYQGAKLKRLGVNKIDHGLINPDMTKIRYDNKILSVDWSFGYKTGDVFEWLNTKTYWLIYLQELTELAYFRGHIRQCNYTIQWEDEEGNLQSTYAAVQGPLTNEIDFLQRSIIHGDIDLPDYLLTIMIPKTEENLKYFRRYNKFYLNELEDRICWRIHGVDIISSPGVITLAAKEYYANHTEDDIENGIVKGLLVKPIEIINDMIDGPDAIRPKQEVEYAFKGKEVGEWVWDEKDPIKVTVIDERHIKVKWDSTQRGSFILVNGETVKEIKVLSLF